MKLTELFLGELEREAPRVAPVATVHVTRSPPIVGAALLGLDEIGADGDAQARVRRELDERLTRQIGNGR